MDTRWNGYYHPDSIAAFPRSGYSKITEYMTEEPPADKKYLENPLGRTYVGISKDPSVPKLPTQEPYIGWDNYHPNGHLNSQVYALVYKYPYKKLEDAKAAGRDIYKDGLELSNKIKFTEIWADKFKRDIDVKVENRFVSLVRVEAEASLIISTIPASDRTMSIFLACSRFIRKGRTHLYEPVPIRRALP